MNKGFSILVAVVLVLGTVLAQITVAPHQAAAQDSDLKLGVGALEYKQTIASAWTEYVGPEARELFYQLHFQVSNREVRATVPDVGVRITGIDVTAEGWLEPDPDHVAGNAMEWNVGNLIGSPDFYNWFHAWWGDPTKVSSESLRFEVWRTVEPNVIRADETGITQTVTTTIQVKSLPEEGMPVVFAGVEHYPGGIVEAGLLAYGGPLGAEFSSPVGFAYRHWWEWRLEDPAVGQNYTFWLSLDVTRASGVEGPITVVPGGRADLRGVSWTAMEGTSVDVPLEYGYGTVTTSSNQVDWDIGAEESWTVFFRGAVNEGSPPENPRDLIVFSTMGGSVLAPGDGTSALRDFTAPAFTYEAGTVVNLIAVPEEGHRFVRWTGDVATIADVNAASTTIAMGGHYSVRAHFEPTPTYDLTISSTAGGSVTTPGEGTITYYEGTPVSLVATPATGYRFVGWTGDVATVADHNAASTTITIDGNYSITADFEEEPLVPTGCFIATAAYGTAAAEQIDVLREFRDAVLLDRMAGARLVALYYRFSPPVADFIAGNSVLRGLVRELLVTPVAWMIEAAGPMWRY